MQRPLAHAEMNNLELSFHAILAEATAKEEPETAENASIIGVAPTARSFSLCHSGARCHRTLGGLRKLPRVTGC